eukprot:TRINITY_DN27157_c0_g1_i1.p2 TRINITY_DN27157_c0_g1~~TRINITY_DN27157_c0_g1_i1.p2  ORF type:complete len:225 (-),score=87.15 TRINITY_DN27157_c0_g1_i1:148-822(-)
MAQCQARGLWWLTLVSLASVLMVNCTEEAEVMQIHDSDGKWTWKPESVEPANGGNKAAEATFKVLSQAAAKGTRKTDIVLEGRRQSLNQARDGAKDARAELVSANKEVASLQAAKVLAEAGEKHVKSGEDVDRVNELKEQDTADLAAAVDKQAQAKKALEQTQNILAQAEKKESEAAATKLAQEAKSVALAQEQISSMSASKATAKVGEEQLSLIHISEPTRPY